MDNVVMPAARQSMTPSLRRTLHLGGSILALSSVIFVALKLHSYWIGLDIPKITLSAWCLIAFLALIYGSANLLLSFAWWHLLRHFGVAVKRLVSVKIYGVSQLAKYLPGNIFHLAGRQALGMAAGLPAGVLAKSTFWELGAFAIAGSLFAWLILPGIPEAVNACLFLGSAVLIIVLLRTKIGHHPMWSFIYQLLFLIISGMVFIALLYLISDGLKLGFQYFLMIGGAYILAWLVGLVTPGAPAGVGVREMILLLLLKGLVAEMDLLMAVLLGRLVTVVGDFMFFVTISSIPDKFCSFEKKNV